MAKKWTLKEEIYQYKILNKLYIEQNLTIGQIANKFKISDSAVFDRLKRLSIPTAKHLKINFSNKRKLNLLSYSDRLAEFVGIMCGDGHLSDSQIVVNLGNKEKSYANYIQKIFAGLFKTDLKISKRKEGYIDLYVGFVELVRFFKDMGLVSNKVKAQMGIPGWIFENNEFKKSFLRGFFDTDGSVYKLKFGWQISFCNRSLRLLQDSRNMFISLGFRPSRISSCKFYLTRLADLNKFTKEIGSRNLSKYKRLKIINGRFV